MSTVVFRRAKILIDGAELSANFSDGPSVEFSAEMLDETAHGDETRIRKGGLFVERISGGGHAEFGAGALEQIIFERVGVDGTVLCVFPDAITEGSQTARGYAMLGVIEDFTVGGKVGDLLPFTFAANGRGIVP